MGNNAYRDNSADILPERAGSPLARAIAASTSGLQPRWNISRVVVSGRIDIHPKPRFSPCWVQIVFDRVRHEQRRLAAAKAEAQQQHEDQ